MEHLYLNDIVKDHPAEKAAFIFKDQVTTYGQFRQNVEAKAAFLQSRGIREGDRVGLISKNCPQFVETYFACALAGAIVVPINFQLVAAEIAYICQDTGMKVLIAQKPIELADALAELGVEKSPEQFTFEEMVPPAGTSFHAVNRKPEEAVAIIYTSGTTGRPKGAVLSQSGIVANTIGISKRVNMHEEDISLCVLPMYHCFAWVTSVCGNLYFGATIVVQETFHYGDAMKLIHKYHINAMYGVPTMFQLFVNSADPAELAHFRYFVSGGAALPRVLYDEFAKKFGQHVQEGYGLSARRANRGRAPSACPSSTWRYRSRTKRAGKCSWAKSANCAPRARTSCWATGTGPRKRPTRCAAAGSIRKIWPTVTKTDTSISWTA